MKVGIAGSGFMGVTHAQCYQKNADTELYAVAEFNPLRRQNFLHSFPRVKPYEDILEMIDDDEIDIIDICLPTPLHAYATVNALEKDKNVLLEKPIALSLDEAESIKKASLASKGKFMVAHVLRFWQGYTNLNKIIKENLSGEKISTVFANRFNELPFWSEGGWITNDEKSGGLLIDLMIHDIDFIIWNFGKVKKVNCTASFSSKQILVHAMATLEMQSGTMIYVEGGYLNPTRSGLTTQMRIYGTASMVEMYPYEDAILFSEQDKPLKRIDTIGSDGYFEEIKYFVDCVKKNINPEIITTGEAIESLKTCLALKQALKEKEWITIA